MTLLTSSTDRDKLIARVIDDLDKLPKPVAAVRASSLYSEKELRQVTDHRLKHDLCVRLAEYFADYPADGRSYWESFK